MRLQKSKAFSLVELSIVILIIGILIAGITQSSRLLRQSKVRTAQTLTQSSIVNSIKGLVLWMETSMDDSFLTAETDDGTQLSRWNDRNTQTANKAFALKTASATITYKLEGINGVPTVNFSGTGVANTYFSLSSTSATITALPLLTTGNAHTFFMVSKLDNTVTGADTTERFAFYNGNNVNGGWGYLRDGNANVGQRSMFFGNASQANSSTATSTTSAEVISGSYAGGTAGAVTLYTNGLAETLTGATATMIPAAAAFLIGNLVAEATPWKGYISEIIIFDTVLKASDRLDVERYLGKKYGIKVQ